LFKLVFRKALGDANEIYHYYNGIFSPLKLLKTIWDRLDREDPVAAYCDFKDNSQNKESKKNENGDKMWRRYEVNEKKYALNFIYIILK